MKHYGDITKININDVEPVDVVIGGSPCQDLSVAGNRAGLDGERSGLFMEQIRIVKEMRERYGKETNGRAGRFMLWENVPGAFSSNKGRDFGTVLHEVVKIAEPKAPPIPMPKNGWPTSGCLTDVAGRWSVAWRVLDAQFWGVPQRRRRIALVGDFGGATAPEILFERDGVQGGFEPCEPEREGSSGTVEGRVGDSIAYRKTGHARTALDGQGWERTDKADTLNVFDNTAARTPLLITEKTYCLQGNGINRADNAGCGGRGWTEDVCYTLNTVDRPAVVVYDARGNGSGGVCPTLTGDHQDRVTDYTALCVGNGQMCNITMKPVANTLDTMHDQQAIICLDRAAIHQEKNASFDFRVSEDGIANPLVASDYKGGQAVMAVDFRNGRLQEVNGTPQAKSNGGTSLNTNNVVLSEVTGTLSPGAYPGGFNGQDVYQNLLALSPCVRRLTPLECERLQGFPDFWTLIGKPIGYEKYTFTDTGETWIDTIYEYTDSTGKKRKTSDSARYKALGNSIAIPPWTYVLSRLRRYLPENPTMASLFDGISGFPLIGMRVGIKPVWASEIEEFCIAVAKERFGED